MKKDFLYKYLILSFIFLEISFKLINNLAIFDISTLFVVTFSCILVTLISLLLDFAKQKFKVVVSSVLLFIFGIYFAVHTCLFNMYKFYFQFSSLSLLDQVAGFASDGLKVVFNNIIPIIVFLIPFIGFVAYFRRFVDDTRTNIKLSVIVLGFSLVFYLPFSLDPYGYVYKTFVSNNMIQIVNKNGVFSGLFYDTYKAINGGDANIVVIEEENIQEEESDIEYEDNILNIDFDALNEKTTNKSIIDLNNYFATKTPTKKNEYTGFFKDKNLILFMAESFNGICVNKDLTPTLYKLVHNGFEFTNFYSPTIYSTIGGEFTELTSLFPDLGTTPNTLSIFRSTVNTYPMGIGNVFNDIGYSTYSYHDSSFDFQDRNIYLNNLGFRNYYACGLGLEKEMDCGHWPASDVDMINVTFDDYINDDNFLVFYASVSGHGPYMFVEKENKIAPKYEQQLREYYGDRLGKGNEADMLMSYIAGQMELDKALETLINKLDAAGKLDDTVIALVGDHHPYYLTENMSIDSYNKLSTYYRDEYIELYHSNFILYNSAMDTVTVDKVGSQLDVIPTIYNLFGINYDSRLLMGTDLLSTTPSIAIMGDDSWVNDHGKYYAISGAYESSDGLQLGDSYIDLINSKVKNIQKVSILIMKNNYYQFIYENK